MLLLVFGVWLFNIQKREIRYTIVPVFHYFKFERIELGYRIGQLNCGGLNQQPRQSLLTVAHGKSNGQ